MHTSFLLLHPISSFRLFNIYLIRSIFYILFRVRHPFVVGINSPGREQYFLQSRCEDGPEFGLMILYVCKYIPQ